MSNRITLPVTPGLALLVSSLALSVSGPVAAQAQAVGGTGPAPAYYVAEFDPTDPEGIKPYSQTVSETFAPYGGRFIVRGGELIALEGAKLKPCVVVIRFDSLQKAREWYDSPEYTALRPIRKRAGETDVYIVEGTAD